MSDYYKGKRTRNIYDPKSSEPFKLSRSKIELFMNCPLCFYIDRRLGVGQPPGYPFNLNSAVDKLLKKEFDKHRISGVSHPLMNKNAVDAVPFQHAEIDEWRENFKGIQFLHEPTNLIITGAVDDVWVRPDGELIVADYKATSKAEEITSLDKGWQIGYKRQAEVYQWLLRQKGFRVSNTAYFVYANADSEKPEFGDTLTFDTRLIQYSGNADWVEPTLLAIKACLNRDELPEGGAECDFCTYRNAVENTQI